MMAHLLLYYEVITMKKETEQQMRYKTKIVIFLVAVLLTFVGFNLMTSSAAVEMVKLGNQPDYTISIHVVAKTEALPTSSITGHTFFKTSTSFFLHLPACWNEVFNISKSAHM